MRYLLYANGGSRGRYVLCGYVLGEVYSWLCLMIYVVYVHISPKKGRKCVMHDVFF